MGNNSTGTDSTGNDSIGTRRPQTRATEGGGGEVFRERMHPAWWWWLVAMAFWLSVAVAMWAYLDWPWALGVTLAVVLLTGSWILQFGMTVRADAAGLRVGRNRIDWRWVASARGLDAASTTAFLDDPAHHRVFLAVRPYAKQSVLFTLADPADPHPAWIVSTRRPEQLAALANRQIARLGH